MFTATACWHAVRYASDPEALYANEIPIITLWCLLFAMPATLFLAWTTASAWRSLAGPVRLTQGLPVVAWLAAAASLIIS